MMLMVSMMVMVVVVVVEEVVMEILGGMFGEFFSVSEVVVRATKMTLLMLALGGAWASSNLSNTSTKIPISQ